MTTKGKGAPNGRGGGWERGRGGGQVERWGLGMGICCGGGGVSGSCPWLPQGSREGMEEALSWTRCMWPLGEEAERGGAAAGTGGRGSRGLVTLEERWGETNRPW